MNDSRAWQWTAILAVVGSFAVIGATAINTPEKGIASVYTIASNGGTVVACPGQKLDEVSLIAAHKYFTCGSKVRVVNLQNQKEVEVRIIDRGPYIAGRIIDLNPASAAALGVNGLARVEITKM